MTTINGIPSDQVNARLKEINSDTPILWTTSLIKAPQELTARTATRNNIMLDKVLENQNTIMQNQGLMMQKMGIGQKLNVNA